MKSMRYLALAAIAGSAVAAPALANEMVIGFGPGGGYDRWGRTVARHLENHLPGNPTVVAKNMPGAGSLKAANYIYTVAPKDGTVIGIIARDVPLGPLTGMRGAQFDARKFTWLGSPTSETNVCIVHKNAPVQSFEALKTKELVIGNTGVGTGTHSYPKALSELLGLKFKNIGGYASSSDVFLAMERGEVYGICESYDSVHGKRPTWIEDGTVKVLFQAALEPNPHIKAPFLFDYVKDEDTRKALTFLYAGQGIGRPFVAPPALKGDAEKTLRTAFDTTMKDPAFVKDAKQQKLDVEPVSGDRLAKLINDLYATPKPIVEKIGKIITGK